MPHHLPKGAQQHEPSVSSWSDTLTTAAVSKTPRGRSRAAILHVFAESVADRGYSDTALSDVSSTLGISKGTIVHHFGTKERLLSEVHAAYFQRRFAEARFIDQELNDPATRLAAFVYALLAAHRDDRAASLTFLREFVRYVDGGLSAHVRFQRDTYHRMVVGIIEEGVHTGTFRTTDASLTALHIFGMCNYAWTWYRPDGKKSVEEIAAVFARDVLLGLYTPANNSRDDLDKLIATAIDTVTRAPDRLPPATAPSPPHIQAGTSRQPIRDRQISSPGRALGVTD